MAQPRREGVIEGHQPVLGTHAGPSMASISPEAQAMTGLSSALLAAFMGTSTGGSIGGTRRTGDGAPLSRGTEVPVPGLGHPGRGCDPSALQARAVSSYSMAAGRRRLRLPAPATAAHRQRGRGAGGAPRARLHATLWTPAHPPTHRSLSGHWPLQRTHADPAQGMAPGTVACHGCSWSPWRRVPLKRAHHPRVIAPT